MGRSLQILKWVFLAVSTLAIPACALNSQVETRPDSTPTQNPSQTSTPANWRSVDELTAAKGTAACIPRSQQVAGFLGANEKGATTLLYFDQQSEREELISSIILNGHQGGIALGIMDISQGDNCVATYEVVRAWAKKCSDVLFNNYPNFTLAAAINSSTRIYSTGENLHLITWQLPASGCFTLQKEMLH
ncbi:MAG: hypothetical protein ABW078_13635 [Sedimenticola sp.]